MEIMFSVISYILLLGTAFAVAVALLFGLRAIKVL